MSGENIFNLIPVPVEVIEKPPMYRSKHDPYSSLAGSTLSVHGTTRLPGAGKTLKKEAAVFGPQERKAPDPHDFLKVRTGRTVSAVIHVPEKDETSVEVRRTQNSRPWEERPVMGLKSNKNFITANAVEVILQVPQRVHEPGPNYLAKVDFGKVPEYLSQVKEEIRRENEMIDAYVSEMGRTQVHESASAEELSDDERRSLLSALKTKWDSVNKQYQKQAHIVKLDTVGKIRRKETLEKELAQLEGDIKKLASRGPVLVENDF